VQLLLAASGAATSSVLLLREEGIMAVTDRIRAEVFTRDRAICAFSGRPLWNLDTGPTPFWDMDWVDHIRPSSRGGSDELDNLVCSSSFHNSKKANNSADTGYMFRCGLPTDSYFDIHRVVPVGLANDLRRFRELDPSDWYLNRAIANILVYLDGYYFGGKYKRKKSFWCQSAWGRIKLWQIEAARPGYRSLRSRGLIRYPSDASTLLFLKLTTARSLRDVLRVASDLWPYLLTNYDAWFYFIEAKSHRKRMAILRRAVQNRRAHPHLVAAMRSNVAALREFDEICHLEPAASS
jgi:hypothetical protein